MEGCYIYDPRGGSAVLNWIESVSVLDVRFISKHDRNLLCWLDKLAQQV